jgi:uncharacterized protein YaeQ
VIATVAPGRARTQSEGRFAREGNPPANANTNADPDVFAENQDVALTSTIYTFEIDLADTDRGVYETLAMRAARHPSESEEYFVARVLAYTLEYEEGIAFSPGGLSEPDDPPIAVRDLTGALRAWIEIGTPDAARLHRAAKAAPRLAVYVHKDPRQFLERLAGERIHRAEQMRLWALDRPLVAALVARLARRMTFGLTITDRELFVSIGDETLHGEVTALTVPM